MIEKKDIRSSAAEYLTFVAATGESEESVEMRYEDENIWLTQKMMATLYDVSVPAISQHIKKIYEDGELDEGATIKKYLIVQSEGDRVVSREVSHYNLQMIIAVGFKVNNERAVQFRKWANGVLEELKKKGSGVSVCDLKADSSPEMVYERIRSILLESRNRAYSAVNFSMVLAYWHVGQVLVELGEVEENRRHGLVKQVSKRLTSEFGKGFDVRNLQQMKRFYLTFPNANALRSHLSWTHYRLLLRVENAAAREWYMEEAVKSAWSSRQLERQISTLYYERMLKSSDKGAVVLEAEENLSKVVPEDFMKDPYVLEFLNLRNYPALRETDLESALIDNLQYFLLELGRGFCFVARQKLLRFEDDDFYVDLVFYHSVLKCHVLIDLKVGKLTHGDVGQMESYIRMYDDLYRNTDDNPTIGIILCSQKNEAIVKYSVLSEAKQIFASKYVFELPTTDELAGMLEFGRENVERLAESKIEEDEMRENVRRYVAESRAAYVRERK